MAETKKRIESNEQVSENDEHKEERVDEEFEIVVRELDVPARPRGVLAE